MNEKGIFFVWMLAKNKKGREKKHRFRKKQKRKRMRLKKDYTVQKRTEISVQPRKKVYNKRIRTHKVYKYFTGFINWHNSLESSPFKTSIRKQLTSLFWQKKNSKFTAFCYFFYIYQPRFSFQSTRTTSESCLF